ncbi:hypothetical protein [Pararhizobium sp. PWRC1-1]|uniref:hypothetical protein n=1 Tax=Pararhizobium sp. PWRC1-1 TaxID=2804566 RepID=UPI003CF7E4A9
MSTCLKLALLAAIWPTSVAATIDADPMLDVFQRICLAPDSGFEEMTVSAATLGWPPIPAGDFARLAPLEHAEAMKGWWASSETVAEKIMEV